MKVILLLAVASVVFVCDASGQLAHDVSADSAILPMSAPIGNPFMQIVRITNRGSTEEQMLPVGLIIRDRFGTVVYRDTQWVPKIKSGETLDIRFADCTPLTNGVDVGCGLILRPDQNQSNDMTCASVLIAFERNAQALSVTYPKQGDSIPYDTRFRPQGVF